MVKRSIDSDKTPALTGRYDAIVVGGGPAGLAATLALARAGAVTALVRRPPPPDNRTTALLEGSLRFLGDLGLLEGFEGRTAPLATMRIVDVTGRLVRAPTVTFRAHELGLDAFGRNVLNTDLVSALDAAIALEGGVTVFDSGASDAVIGADAVEIVTDAGARLTAPVAVAADGAKSMLREAAGIATRAWRYPQTAVTLNLTHTVPHRDASTEFHGPHGPFTLVPLPGLRSSLVAVVSPADADHLLALDDAALGAEIETRSHSLLGRTRPDGPRGAWPLSGLVPDRFGANRVLLVGEAGHVLPPIGAQGLNLGLRDAAAAADVIGRALSDGSDPGGADVTAAYDRARRSDVRVRSTMIDLVNRTLLSPLLPAQALRGVGLWAAGAFGPLRRLVMREGIEPRLSPRP